VIASPSILLADTREALRQIRRLLGDSSTLFNAETWEEALTHMSERSFDLIIVGYHFDTMRPYRLIAYIAREVSNPPPVVVVRGLPVHSFQQDDAQIALAYRGLGAAEYIPLDKAAGPDDEGAQRLRRAVQRLLAERQSALGRT